MCATDLLSVDYDSPNPLSLADMWNCSNEWAGSGYQDPMLRHLLGAHPLVVTSLSSSGILFPPVWLWCKRSLPFFDAALASELGDDKTFQQSIP